MTRAAAAFTPPLSEPRASPTSRMQPKPKPGFKPTIFAATSRKNEVWDRLMGDSNVRTRKHARQGAGSAVEDGRERLHRGRSIGSARKGARHDRHLRGVGQRVEP